MNGMLYGLSMGLKLTRIDVLVSSWVEIIPVGAMYDQFGVYNLLGLIAPSTSYSIIFGDNDSELANAPGTPLYIHKVAGVVPFTSSDNGLGALFGTANTSVTAIIHAVPPPTNYLLDIDGNIMRDSDGNPILAL